MNANKSVRLAAVLACAVAASAAEGAGGPGRTAGPRPEDGRILLDHVPSYGLRLERQVAFGADRSRYFQGGRLLDPGAGLGKGSFCALRSEGDGPHPAVLPAGRAVVLKPRLSRPDYSNASYRNRLLPYRSYHEAREGGEGAIRLECQGVENDELTLAGIRGILGPEASVVVDGADAEFAGAFGAAVERQQSRLAAAILSAIEAGTSADGRLVEVDASAEGAALRFERNPWAQDDDRLRVPKAALERQGFTVVPDGPDDWQVGDARIYKLIRGKDGDWAEHRWRVGFKGFRTALWKAFQLHEQREADAYRERVRRAERETERRMRELSERLGREAGSR